MSPPSPPRHASSGPSTSPTEEVPPDRERASSRPVDGLWRGALAALCVGGISLAHLPAELGSHDSFDLVKRLEWVLLLAALTVVRLFSRSGSVPLRRILPAWLLLGWFALRALFRPVPDLGLDVLAAWSFPVIAFLAVAGLRPRAGTARGFALGIVAVMCFQGGLMLLQFAGLDPLFSSVTREMAYRPGRMIGTIGYHNQAADFLALCAPLLLIFRRGWVPLAGFACTGLLIALCASRGALLGFSAASALLLINQLRTGRRMAPGHPARVRAQPLLIASLLFALVLVAIPDTRRRLMEVSRLPATEAFATRAWMFRAAVDMWRDKPLVGWGPGEFAYQYGSRLGALLPAEKTAPILKQVVYARETHNDYLQCLAEFGLVGLVLFAAWLLPLARVGRSGEDDEGRGAIRRFVLVYMAVQSLVSFPWQTSMAGPFAGLLLGLSLPPRTTTPAGSRLGAALTLLPLAGLLVWFALENRWNINAPSASSFRPERLEHSPLPRSAYRYKSSWGAWLAKNDRPDEALTVLREASAGWRDPRLLHNLIQVLLLRDRPGEALPLCREWVASGLLHKDALWSLALTHERMQANADAILALQQHQRLWPDRDPERDLRLGGLLMKANRPLDCIELLAGYATARELPALEGKGRVTRSGAIEPVRVSLVWLALPLDAGRELRGIRLPDRQNARLFAATLASGRERHPVRLDEMLHLDGSGEAGIPVPRTGGLDRRGHALPTDLFPKSGFLRVNAGGESSTWVLGVTAGDRPNTLEWRGQSIPAPTGRYDRLDLLATSVDGLQPLRGLLHVEYADGESPLPYSLPDWCQPGAASYPGPPPTVSRILNLVGAAWRMLGRDDPARPHFEAALQLDPTNQPARLNLESTSPKR
jgi:O-antigen ligase